MTTSNKTVLNRIDEASLATMCRLMALGSVLIALPASLRKSATAAVAYSGAPPAVSAQNQEAPALTILSAYGRAGTAPAAALTVGAYPPAAGEIAIAPNGSIVTNAADAWTSVDVAYTVDKGEVVEFTGDVAANILTLPTGITTRGAIRLLEAEALVGTSTGAKFCDVIGAAPAAGEAALTTGLATVRFNGGDAVTKARVKLLVCSDVELTSFLAAASSLV